MQLQSAADAGVLSSAIELQAGNSATWQNAATTEVTNLAALNAYPVPTIAVQKVATYGTYAGNSSTVQITLTQQVPTYFLCVLGAANRNASLTVRAVALRPGSGAVELVD